MSSQAVTLNDATCNHAPSKHVLSVSTVGDVVFLSIGEYDETHDSHTVTTTAEIPVDGRSLIAAVELLLAHDQRHQDAERQRVFSSGCDCD